MLKDLLKKFVVYLSAVSFISAGSLAYAEVLPSNPLPPISKAHMYQLARNGNVKALRYAAQRGLDVDSVDRYGNSGLCHAIYRDDCRAYNTFRAAGANPRHPCTQTIPAMSEYRESPRGNTARS